MVKVKKGVPNSVIKDPYWRTLQRHFDREFIDRNYIDLNSKEAKIRHISHHVGKAGFKLSEIERFGSELRELGHLEAREYRLNSIIGDLAIYRTQLANVARVNLARLLESVETEPMTLGQAVNTIAYAHGALNYRTEPLEHGSRPKSEMNRLIQEVAIPELHRAAEGLRLQTYPEDALTYFHLRRLSEVRHQIS